MRRLTACFGLLAALGLWQGLAWLFADSVLFAGPTDIAVYVANHLGLLGRAVLATGRNAALGFVCGNLAAVAMAAMVILIPRTERLTSAIALVLFSLPLVASGPILGVTSGPGDAPQIALSALAVYYTTYLAMLAGLRALPSSWPDLMAIYGRGPVKTLITVRARASLPYLFVGLQIAAPAAVLGAMIGEFTGAERGLGVLTLRAMRGLDVDATWALAGLSASVALLAYDVLGRLGRYLVGYAPVIILSPPLPLRTMPLWRRLLALIGITLTLLLLWQVSMDAFALNRFFAKRPGDVWTFLVSSTDARVTLLAALAETFAGTIPGYLAGMLLGAGLAAAVMLLPDQTRFILPSAVALRAIPIITTAPLIVLALGRGAVGTIAVVAVMIFFPSFVACLQGLRQTPAQVIDLFDCYGSGRLRLLWTARFPAMLPAFFAAAKMAVPAAVLAVTTTEWLATGRGIGSLMALTSTTSDYNMLWSSIVAITLVAIAMYAVVIWLERAILRIYAREQMT